uniref:Uncharacterized protein n=1 Tax=Cacopsylla melanoneura TaxID=428564 RepID=A0A8D9BBX7_9HEMI
MDSQSTDLMSCGIPVPNSPVTPTPVAVLNSMSKDDLTGSNHQNQKTAKKILLRQQQTAEYEVSKPRGVYYYDKVPIFFILQHLCTNEETIQYVPFALTNNHFHIRRKFIPCNMKGMNVSLLLLSLFSFFFFFFFFFFFPVLNFFF